MRMQLRCYLGACLYDPEKVVIVPDVQFECVVSDEQCDWETVQDDLGLEDISEGAYGGFLGDSAYRTADGTYYPNTGELGWLDYSDCQRVHGAYTYDDDIKRDAILKEMYKSESKRKRTGPTDDEERTVNLALPGDDDLIDLGATASSMGKRMKLSTRMRAKMNNGETKKHPSKERTSTPDEDSSQREEALSLLEVAEAGAHMDGHEAGHMDGHKKRGIWTDMKQILPRPKKQKIKRERANKKNPPRPVV